MIRNSTKENLKSFGLKKLISFVDSNPDKNVPKIVSIMEKIDDEGIIERQLNSIKSVIGDKDSNWYKFMKSFWSDIDDDVRKKIFENLSCLSWFWVHNKYF